MATVLRPVGHDDKLSIVEHLDELRTRLIVCLLAFLACFAVCFWQNDFILDALNRPLEKATPTHQGSGPLGQAATFQQRVGDMAASAQQLADALAGDDAVSSSTRAAARAHARDARDVASHVPRATPREPVTLGVAEPFVSTFKVSAYAALLLSLPILLWQLYAFVLPAFSRREREVAVPLMAMVPFLFTAGAAFAYFLVLPKAIDVLQNFNDDQFDILIQAKDLYSFSILTCVALGVLFQMPIAILMLTRMEIVSVRQLRANRGYAILIIAVLAMLLPGTDPISMLLGMLPLVVLFEASILLAALLEKRAAQRPGTD